MKIMSYMEKVEKIDSKVKSHSPRLIELEMRIMDLEGLTKSFS